MRNIPDPADATRRTAVYRIYDADDRLLYVGIAFDVGRRWAQHAKIQRWWSDVARQTVEWYPARSDAEQAERTAIKTEKPKYNITYGSPEYLLSDAEQLKAEHDKRYAPMVTHFDGSISSQRFPDCPDIVAPGTYLITLAYNPDADPQVEDHVTVTRIELIEAGDEFAAQYGGRCFRRTPDGDRDSYGPLKPPCECCQCSPRSDIADALDRAQQD